MCIRDRCGSFKPSLHSSEPPRKHTNPTSRQRVDRSSPLYNRQNQPASTRIPHRGSVWIVQVLSTIVRTTPRAHESHIAAACGSFKLSLHSLSLIHISAHTRLLRS